jgi:hypothetical protein
MAILGSSKWRLKVVLFCLGRELSDKAENFLIMMPGLFDLIHVAAL